MSVRQPRLAPRDATCQRCGAVINPAQKYCKDCAPVIVKENILKAGSLGRQNTHSPQAQARRSKTQQRQNAALKVWNPRSLPNWLNKEFYNQSIQPRLSSVRVLQIMSALSVSEPYALSVRSGRRTPHPRHWLALAELAGASGVTTYSG